MAKGKYSDAIRKAVIQAGAHANTHTLKQLGYTQREIEKAVTDGVVAWTRAGNLVAK